MEGLGFEVAATKRRGNNLSCIQGFRTENGPSQGQNLALTCWFIPSSLDSGVRFRGALVFKAHRLLYHSIPGLRVRREEERVREPAEAEIRPPQALALRGGLIYFEEGLTFQFFFKPSSAPAGSTSPFTAKVGKFPFTAKVGESVPRSRKINTRCHHVEETSLTQTEL